ncbi:MAG TPA: hypothetical protein VFJ16_05005 [Longimicrobium sp.]|nr:hypothetical protein [Longimicrobium sp.]
MSTFLWIVGAVACAIAWLAGEALWQVLGGLAGGMLGWLFSPLRRAFVTPVYDALLRRLASPAGAAWQASLIALFVSLAVGGGALVATVAPSPWFALGACATIAGLMGLMVLESARLEVLALRSRVPAEHPPSANRR